MHAPERKRQKRRKLHMLKKPRPTLVKEEGTEELTGT